MSRGSTCPAKRKLFFDSDPVTSYHRYFIFSNKVYGGTPAGSITASILMMWMRRTDPTLGKCSYVSAPFVAREIQ
jgi:hypothetical protein